MSEQKMISQAHGGALKIGNKDNPNAQAALATVNNRMRPGKHGGMLKSGGVNRNAGRPPNAIRAMWSELGARAVVELQCRDLTEATLRDLLAIADIASKYCLSLAAISVMQDEKSQEE